MTYLRQLQEELSAAMPGTRADMARAIGVTQGQVWRILDGASVPSATTLEAWSRACGAAEALDRWLSLRGRAEIERSQPEQASR